MAAPFWNLSFGSMFSELRNSHEVFSGPRCALEKSGRPRIFVFSALAGSSARRRTGSQAAEGLRLISIEAFWVAPVRVFLVDPKWLASLWLPLQIIQQGVLTSICCLAAAEQFKVFFGRPTCLAWG